MRNRKPVLPAFARIHPPISRIPCHLLLRRAVDFDKNERRVARCFESGSRRNQLGAGAVSSKPMALRRTAAMTSSLCSLGHHDAAGIQGLGPFNGVSEGMQGKPRIVDSSAIVPESERTHAAPSWSLL